MFDRPNPVSQQRVYNRETHRMGRGANLCLEITETFPQFGQLGRCDKIVVEILNHDAGKLDIFLLLDAIGQRPVYALSAKARAQLANNQIAARLEKSPVC